MVTMKSSSVNLSHEHPELAEPDDSKQRWLKIDVDEELFHHLHVVAAQSRMRFTPYLRRFLKEAKVYGDQEATES